MDINTYREEIKLELTGGVLDLELDDKALDMIINKSLREVQRYISSTVLETIPFAKCIDLSAYKINSIINVFRADGYINDGDSTIASNGYAPADPMQSSQWQMLAGVGNLTNFSNYTLNYLSWNTLLQIRNTISTDMAFRYDPNTKKLYINASTGFPSRVTIMYIPRYEDVSEVISDYWIDVISKLSIALTKMTLGRIRSRYTQSNALWQQDGATLLQEGTAELQALRQHLVDNSLLMFPYD